MVLQDRILQNISFLYIFIIKEFRNHFARISLGQGSLLYERCVGKNNKSTKLQHLGCTPQTSYTTNTTSFSSPFGVLFKTILYKQSKEIRILAATCPHPHAYLTLIVKYANCSKFKEEKLSEVSWVKREIALACLRQVFHAVWLSAVFKERSSLNFSKRYSNIYCQLNYIHPPYILVSHILSDASILSLMNRARNLLHSSKFSAE